MIVVTQRDLGQMIGMSRESTNKQLKAWQRAGWIEIVKGGLEFRDLDALAAVGDGAES
jgi:DNA-binding Lrp family transcriptional regulator